MWALDINGIIVLVRRKTREHRHRHSLFSLSLLSPSSTHPNSTVHAEERPPEDIVRPLWARKRAFIRNQVSWNFHPGLLTPELWENKFVLFKCIIPSLWHYVMATRAIRLRQTLWRPVEKGDSQNEARGDAMIEKNVIPEGLLSWALVYHAN